MLRFDLSDPSYVFPLPDAAAIQRAMGAYLETQRVMSLREANTLFNDTMMHRRYTIMARKIRRMLRKIYLYVG